MVSKRLLKNGAIGLVVMVGVGLVPLAKLVSPVVGGGVAGYLHRRGMRTGAIAGAVTGLLWTLVTLVLLVVVVVGAGLTAPPGVGPLAWLPAAGGGTYIVVLFVYQNALVILLAVIGGAIGGYLVKRREQST